MMKKKCKSHQKMKIYLDLMRIKR